jgi:hypothetical protein
MKGTGISILSLIFLFLFFMDVRGVASSLFNRNKKGAEGFSYSSPKKNQLIFIPHTQAKVIIE